MMESRPKWRISQNLAWEIPVDRRKAWPPQYQISKIGMPPFYGIVFTGRGGWSCERRCPSIDQSLGPWSRPIFRSGMLSYHLFQLILKHLQPFQKGHPFGSGLILDWWAVDRFQQVILHKRIDDRFYCVDVTVRSGYYLSYVLPMRADVQDLLKDLTLVSSLPHRLIHSRDQ